MPLVDNSLSEEPVEQEGGHEPGPQKGQLDGLAHEQPSSVATNRIDSEGADGKVPPSTEDLGAASGSGLAVANAGDVLDVDESYTSEVSKIECGVILNETPVLVHQWRHQEQPSVALDLQLIGDSSEARSKRLRKTTSIDKSDETTERRGHCPAHRHRVPAGGVPRHHADCTRRNSNRSIVPGSWSKEGPFAGKSHGKTGSEFEGFDVE